MHYRYTDPDEAAVTAALDRRQDPRALRMKKMLAMPDLTRQPGSPLHYVVNAIKGIDALSGHDEVEFPHIVPTTMNFDLLGTPPDHKSRGPGDTWYADDVHVLRTQTTTMWPYYLSRRSRRATDDRGQKSAQEALPLTNVVDFYNTSQPAVYH